MPVYCPHCGSREDDPTASVCALCGTELRLPVGREGVLPPVVGLSTNPGLDRRGLLLAGLVGLVVLLVGGGATAVAASQIPGSPMNATANAAAQFGQQLPFVPTHTPTPAPTATATSTSTSTPTSTATPVPPTFTSTPVPTRTP